MSSKNLAIAYAAKRRSKIDRANFLSDEDKVSELNFPDAQSDEELLDESGFNPESKMDNEMGNEDQVDSRASTIAEIMRRMRKGR